MKQSRVSVQGVRSLGRDAARFSNPGGQAVMQWALVGIGLTESPNSGWAKAHLPTH